MPMERGFGRVTVIGVWTHQGHHHRWSCIAVPRGIPPAPGWVVGPGAWAGVVACAGNTGPGWGPRDGGRAAPYCGTAGRGCTFFIIGGRGCAPSTTSPSIHPCNRVPVQKANRFTTLSCTIATGNWELVPEIKVLIARLGMNLHHQSTRLDSIPMQICCRCCSMNSTVL